MILKDIVESISAHITMNNIKYIWNSVYKEEQINETINEDIFIDLKEELLEFFNDIVNEDIIIKIYNYLLDENLDYINTNNYSSYYDDEYE